MDKTVTIYHNPRCSKSRATMELLNSEGITPEVVQYLDTPPSADELRAVLKKLGIGPAQLIRTGEDIYKELDLKNRDLSDDELIDIMASNPKLIERPIVITGNKAAIGRPPETVLDIL